MFKDLRTERVYRTRIGHAIDEVVGDIRDRFSVDNIYGESILERYFLGSTATVLFPLALAFYIMDSTDDLKTIRE